jgi:hypothetical protein
MLKKGASSKPAEPEPVLFDGTDEIFEEGDVPKRPDFPLPMSSEQLRMFLIQAFASNYESKFGKKHVQAKNQFSVSSLVSGPGSTLGQRRRTLENTNKETGEEAKVFSFAMFRGSAIHDYANQKLAYWYSYEKLNTSYEFEYPWKDPNYKTIIMSGHPDLVHYGKLSIGDTVVCDDPEASLVLEMKSIISAEKDLKKQAQYKATVIKKAKRQAGCYARMLEEEIGRRHAAYVVIFDETPAEHPLTDEDKARGYALINDGQTVLPLDEKITKRGFVYDSSLRTYPLSNDEIWHGWNYCLWSARECARMIEEEEQK